MDEFAAEPGRLVPHQSYLTAEPSPNAQRPAILLMRGEHIRKILTVALDRGPVTARQFAYDTGLSVVTVNAILHELTARGLLVFAGLQPTSRGRHARACAAPPSALKVAAAVQHAGELVAASSGPGPRRDLVRGGGGRTAWPVCCGCWPIASPGRPCPVRTPRRRTRCPSRWSRRSLPAHRLCRRRRWSAVPTSAAHESTMQLHPEYRRAPRNWPAGALREA